MLRKRNVHSKTIKELDVFLKVPESYIKQSAVGGTFSVISFCIIIYLIYAETQYFFDSKLKFKFEPDTDIDERLQINVDITVAMPCIHIGADVLDSTNQNLMGFKPLETECTWWELTPEQQAHFEVLRHMNSYFREEYHAIHELLWKSNQPTLLGDIPKRISKPEYAPNACRIYGSINVNKVAGNFHITSGKSLSLPRGHIHISTFMTDRDYNFSHRINKFSFGVATPGIIHPLEGDEKIANDYMMLYQYFISVVPTDIDLLMYETQTYQYSVKDHQRPINHGKDSHGMPGIFFKYDMSALRVTVSQQRDSIFQFLIKLCATVGGIYVTNGIANSIVQNFWHILCCKFLSSENMDDKKSIFQTNEEICSTVDLTNVSAPIDVDVLKS